MGDPRIKYEIVDCVEPGRISPASGTAFELIEHTTMQLYPEAVVIPGIMVGQTDSRFYINSTRNIYRYIPIKIKPFDLKG